VRKLATSAPDLSNFTLWLAIAIWPSFRLCLLRPIDIFPTEDTALTRTPRIKSPWRAPREGKMTEHRLTTAPSPANEPHFEDCQWFIIIVAPRSSLGP